MSTLPTTRPDDARPLACLRPRRHGPPPDAGERTADVVQAEARGLRCAHLLGLHADMLGFGGDPTVFACTLRHADGSVAGRGLGAGSTGTARTGALLEALEGHAARRRQPGRRAGVPSRAPARGPAVGAVGGTGIGCTDAEALLHAVNEAVERMAVARFLAAAVPYGPNAGPATVPVLDRATLPPGLADVVDRTEHRIGARVDIAAIEAPVPVFLAYAVTTAGEPPRLGLGTSLSPAFAVRRACRGLLEDTLPAGTAWGRHPTVVSADAAHMTTVPAGALPPWAAVLPLGERDGSRYGCTGRGDGGRAEPMPFVADGAPASPAAHLRRIVDLLADRGMSLRVATLTDLPAGLELAHTLLVAPRTPIRSVPRPAPPPPTGAPPATRRVRTGRESVG
ncbi:YcaO-like family protein [Streptomyces sp. NPDC001568]|uniref:YcaO-like family protein n=1 Tax=Streptomyces sp. NPDC001568 TaxID=3364588 RepID=UPI0036A522EF